MIEFVLESGLWALLLTLGAYQLGLFLRKKTGLAICNPLLISAAVVIPVLLLTGLPNEGYQKGMDSISWLMTPCTVSLAIPLYTQMKLLKGKLPAVIAGAAAGALCSLLTVGLCCWALQMDNAVVISLLPKSVTTAIAMPLAENNGGIAPLTTAVVAIGVVLLIPLQPIIQSPVLTPAFDNVVPALFGAMAFQYFRKGLKIVALPLTVMTALFVFVPSLIGSVGFMIIPSGAMAIGIGYVLWKKERKKISE